MLEAMETKLNLLFATFFFISLVLAIPLPLYDDDDLPACSEYRRTVWSIVLDCSVTIFACTWFSVHPNVPGRRVTSKGWFAKAMERAKLMAFASLAPEVIVAWALRQLIVALKVYHLDKDERHTSIFSYVIQKIKGQTHPDPEKLTMAHGFVISMGGFYDKRNEKLIRLHSLELNPRLADYVKRVDVLSIQDRSKGDALSKAISTLQISWFIVGCLARAHQDLPITLLELTALAFALLSIITYVIWWHKPIDIQCHICVDTTPSDPEVNPGTALPEVNPRIGPLPNDGYLLDPSSPLFSTLRFISNVMDADDTLSDPRTPTTETNGVFARLWNCMQIWIVKAITMFARAILSVLLWIVLGTIGAVAGCDLREARMHDTVDDGASPFSCGAANQRKLRFATILGTGALFGAVHCAAWLFIFPSRDEMILWRFSSVAVLLGLLGTLCIIAAEIWDEGRLGDFITIPLPQAWKKHRIWEVLGSMMIAFDILAYVTGRIILVVLAFMELRSLPPLALKTIKWTTYIPHI
ncbi:hypothetical protein DFS33DRAFT_1388942 [Desarmillaria ectypa]|nr:hypothetical protein DFS33DRAFT_1388942 [Desarmillaria ectypa]